MEVFEAEGDGGSKEPALIGREGFYRSQVCEELSAVDKFKNQIEILGVLGQSFEVDNKGMVELRMDKVLIIDMINLLSFNNLTLL